MEALTLSNIAAYSAQVVCIVSMAGMALWLLRVHAAPVRYACWRAVLALCLLLPAIQGRQIPTAAAAVPTVDTTVVAGPVSPGPSDTRPESLSRLRSVDWAPLALAVLAAGAALSVAWIGISLLRLRRLRRLGDPAPPSALHTELQAVIGTRCEIRYVASLRQPVTFGFRRPVILLPTALAERSAEIQRAVVSHELFHVKRGDWAWLLFEKGVCALLWFNPAVWWLLSRLHLSREAVVDELAVMATGRRRAYVEALMAFADETSFAAVAAFGGRRQLFDRIVLLSKEAGMSSRRVVLTGAVVAVVLAAGTWRAVSAFPLTGLPGATEQAAPPRDTSAAQRDWARGAVRVDGTPAAPRKIGVTMPEYPPEARAAGVSGAVEVEVLVAPDGTVEDARVVRSIPLLDQAALDAVRKWRFSRTLLNGHAIPIVVTVTVPFQFDTDRQVSRDVRILPPPPPPAPRRTQRERVVEVRPEGPPPPPPAPARVVGVDEHVQVIETPIVVKKVYPVYPVEAMRARIEGKVELEVIIGPEGTVRGARVLRGVPELNDAAVDAVRQWLFKPFEGEPVRRTLELTFALR